MLLYTHLLYVDYGKFCTKAFLCKGFQYKELRIKCNMKQGILFLRGGVIAHIIGWVLGYTKDLQKKIGLHFIDDGKSLVCVDNVKMWIIIK